ncbi:MAG: ATP synthase F1 subunit delta [Acidobacteria bacterium]|jgi:F-type H+-transporting ATPase subunit delta|nr:ATP synthase F1 subunit delta [Acidobacteriota bacterium]
MSGIGRRYAQALIDVAPPGDVEGLMGDLQLFSQWLKDVPELRPSLENPVIPAATKERVVEGLCAQAGFKPQSARFIQMVVSHRRLRQWDEMVAAARALCDARLGILRVLVTTAKPLGEAEKGLLVQRLKELLRSSVEVEAEAAPALIGGIALKVGSTVYDGSVAGSLRAMRSALEKR